MSGLVVCDEPGCSQWLTVDHRHVDNLSASSWLCHIHRREEREYAPAYKIPRPKGDPIITKEGC